MSLTSSGPTLIQLDSKPTHLVLGRSSQTVPPAFLRAIL